ncbi:hypothetical protein P8452_64836 [Trifolium repens]|nr:hypothetical protein P8452_64836 [Trifolium repens]
MASSATRSSEQGTIARLVAKDDSNIEAVKFGSISSLYQSVSDLDEDEQYLWSKTCKEMLLKPRNSMEGYCHQLKLMIDDSDTLMQYFVCGDWDDRRICSLWRNVSTFRNQKCSCGNVLNNRVAVPPTFLISVENGFVKETATISSEKRYLSARRR